MPVVVPDPLPLWLLYPRSMSTITLERPLPYNISINWDRNIYVYK